MAAERYRGQGFGKGEDAGGGEGAHGMARDELRGQAVVLGQRSRARHAGQSATGLRHNAFSAANDAVQIVDCPAQPASALAGRSAQRPMNSLSPWGVRMCLVNGRVGDYAADLSRAGPGFVSIRRLRTAT